ncbi:MAG: hypothetical protein A3F84_26010 [Candidatus Handelsmanbacteria bacterium RIFCSPLOWO2_12_FULL_64_10]|uniref:Outer membrane lipoprotein-sorting protein n=1 Tax=Handelsmanbacteria sp. (strain RIFCSPLOWO2_12_FULL_64_10) TaxID=1817868 RepID=A0A1F6CA48_HANXR|nr:MAG: hypothetical protein A3F84_26010 [Candidatus Handelsmanbacteria bacterium RIFCSPLOWO2_12_FULL_64_10]
MVAAPASAQQADERALQVADAMVKAMGGAKAFEQTRYLRFNFAAEREGRPAGPPVEHLWDRRTGRYRVAWTRDGKRYLALFNVNTQLGKAYADSQEVTGEDLERALKAAYGRFINDTYWLLMPCKLRDPGVRLKYEGERQEEGVTYDVVALSFNEGIGLTPKDRYWAYVNRETGLMDRWAFVLKGADVPPTPFLWKNWQTYGKIKLSNERVNPANGNKILFPALAVPEEVDDRVFEDPNAAVP